MNDRMLEKFLDSWSDRMVNNFYNGGEPSRVCPLNSIAEVFSVSQDDLQRFAEAKFQQKLEENIQKNRVDNNSPDI